MSYEAKYIGSPIFLSLLSSENTFKIVSNLFDTILDIVNKYDDRLERTYVSPNKGKSKTVKEITTCFEAENKEF